MYWAWIRPLSTAEVIWGPTDTDKEVAAAANGGTVVVDALEKTFNKTSPDGQSRKRAQNLQNRSQQLDHFANLLGRRSWWGRRTSCGIGNGESCWMGPVRLRTEHSCAVLSSEYCHDYCKLFWFTKQKTAIASIANYSFSYCKQSPFNDPKCIPRYSASSRKSDSG